MVLVAAVIGTVSAAISIATRPAAESPATAAGSLPLAAVTAAAVAPPVPSTTPAPAHAAPVGALRVHEAAFAEAEYRRTAPAAAARSTPARGGFVRPASGGRTGWFGERRRSHSHVGIDFDGDTGDPVVASGAGTVVHAGSAPSGYSGYGQMVLIDHGEGITTLYAHLSRINVGVGSVVAAGDRVGAIGTTGNVTGSHLHFELRLGGRPVDPAGWLAG